MAKKKSIVEKVILQCGICKEHNYSINKNKRANPERLELKKYCRHDKKHTAHKEIK